MAPSFKDIDLYVKFLPHPAYHDLHSQLNYIYADILDTNDLDKLFTSPSRTAITTNDANAILRCIIVDSIIIPGASTTSDPAEIHRLFDKCTLH